MTAGRKLQVLILDDDAAVAALMRQYLFAEFADDLDLHTLTDPRLAKTWLTERSCDLILSDIEMPGCDGLAILRHAKDANPWTQVIFMTAHSSWDRIAAAIELGAADYLLKPVHRDELLDVVRGEIRRIGRWREAVTGTLKQLCTPAN